MRKIRILFLPLVDADNFNAQSLNTREIALRLDSTQFECSLFYAKAPDERLLNRAHIRLLRLPARLKTLTLLREMWAGHDIIAYMDYSPASYLYLHVPKVLRKHTKTVMHVEGMSKLGDVSRMFKFLYFGTAPKCDFYTCITDRSAQDFESEIHRRVLRILPVGVDRSIFSCRRNLVNDFPVVLFVGTLVERKRPLLLLEAAARFPDVKFRVIGPDRYGYEQIVRSRIAELKISNVILEGPKSQEVIIRAMQESDIFVLPSCDEGLPKVTLEAAASCLPCVVFREYETPSVVNGITGFQVNTIDEMIDRLDLLIKDAQLRQNMGVAARKHTEKFDWDVVVQRWRDAYLEIASA